MLNFPLCFQRTTLQSVSKSVHVMYLNGLQKGDQCAFSFKGQIRDSEVLLYCKIILTSSICNDWSIIPCRC